MQRAEAPAHGEPRRVDVSHLLPALRPCCAGCGARPLVLKKCKGSCGGAGTDGKFCSIECAQRNWTAHKAKTGCHKLAGTARDAGARKPRAALGTRQLLYKAVITDNTALEVFEAAYEVDAATFAAAAAAVPDTAANERLARECVSRSEAAMLRMRAWRCEGCGGADPAQLLHNLSSLLHKQQPLVMDVAVPFCNNSPGCEAACQRLGRLYGDAFKDMLQTFPHLHT